MINKLQYDVKWFQAENAKIKQHYKESFDYVKITRDKNDEKIALLQNEIANLKVLAKGKRPVTDLNYAVCDALK